MVNATCISPPSGIGRGSPRDRLANGHIAPRNEACQHRHRHQPDMHACMHACPCFFDSVIIEIPMHFVSPNGVKKKKGHSHIIHT
jgi:hypothetical protein